MPSRRLLVALLAAAAVTAAGFAIAETAKESGRIGPANRIQPSGRLLNPTGKLTTLGNLPVGGAITPNGRYYWTLSGGRGRNDIRIVRIPPKVDCSRRSGTRRKTCLRRQARRRGKVVQTIEMPGVSGGIVMARDNRTAYVSGVAESGHDDQKVAEDVPGKGGNAVHVFRYDPATGQASRDGVIDVPPPTGTAPPQNFPPTNREAVAWPRDLALSPDGTTLLVALNLADAAAIVDVASKGVRYVDTGSYPYGAAITRDGKLGLVGNEADGNVAVIDLAAGSVTKRIQVGAHLSHPEGIAVDPKVDRAYVAVTNSDQVAVLDLEELRVERTLSVERPAGIGTSPVDVTVSGNGRRLYVPLSGSDEIAVFALPKPGVTTRSSAAERAAERVLTHEGRRNFEEAKVARVEVAEFNGEEAEEEAEAAARKRPVVRQPEAFSLVGRIPVASYPTDVAISPKRNTLVWLSAKGLGVGPNPDGPNPTNPDDTDDEQSRFQYLPTQVFGAAGITNIPTDRRLRKLTPRASRQIRPIAGQKPPAGTPIRADGPIEHVFYIVRENRTYDQIFGAEPRGDGDPNLELFGEKITPNAHALARRFPLLDHVYANSEASIDGHFWTSAASVSDYVVKNWHQNYGARKRPYDFGVYSVTWPSSRFLFDQAEKQDISYFNFGEAIAGTVPLADKDRNAEETAQVTAKFAKSDLGVPNGCFPNDASSGGTDVVLSASGVRVEVYDSSLPPGAPLGSESRYTCFAGKFDQQVRDNAVPAFTYITLSNDHTAGTKPGERTPQAMVAENDLALGEVVDKISHSPIWKKSLILVIEDDSQNGADHVDAHRIPAFAISPYAKRGAVIHTRYDFLSFIRTLEIPIGMKPLNLFDALATPMYDVFTPGADNAEPYSAIPAKINLTDRNTAASPNAKLSSRLNIGLPDRVPQRILDRILWQAVHGADSEPPPPGPNSSPLDEPMARSIEQGDFERYDEHNSLEEGGG